MVHYGNLGKGEYGMKSPHNRAIASCSEVIDKNWDAKLAPLDGLW